MVPVLLAEGIARATFTSVRTGVKSNEGDGVVRVHALAVRFKK